MSRVVTPAGRLLLSAITAILLVGGCSRSTNNPSSGPTTSKPTPEEKFDVIMETFRRRIEGTPSGFVVDNAGGGRSRLMASNKVTSEVIPPAKEGDPYTAEVTVLSEARFSLQRKVDETEESTKKDEQRNDQRSGIPSLDNPADVDKGVGILDPNLVSSHGAEGQARHTGTGPEVGERVVTRREDEEKRVFKLEYKNDRWVLLTTPNPQTERAIQRAFEETLGAQL